MIPAGVQDGATWIRYGALSQLGPRLFAGGYADASDMATLRAHGITHVANLTQESVTPPEAGVEVLVLGQDDGADVSPETIRRFLRWMDAAWAVPDSRILVHCAAGISRTPSFLIAWLMHRAGCHRDSDLRDAWSACEERVALARPFIHPHATLKRGVVAYFSARPPVAP